MKNNSTTTGGIGFIGLLTLIFITLKLIGSIDWSWWAVSSPIWGPFAVFALAFVLYVCIDETSIMWRRRKCIFKGHEYVSEYKRVKLSYGYASRPIRRCTRCGKEIPYKIVGQTKKED